MAQNYRKFDAHVIYGSDMEAKLYLIYYYAGIVDADLYISLDQSLLLDSDCLHQKTTTHTRYYSGLVVIVFIPLALEMITTLT